MSIRFDARSFLRICIDQQLFNLPYYVSVTWNLEWCLHRLARLDFVYVLSAWLGGVGAGYAVHLGSVWAAKLLQ